MILLSEFVGCVVALHSYSYSPVALKATFGGRYGEVTGQLVIFTGDRAGDEVSVYIANRQVVARVKAHLIGNYDGPMYGRVERGEHNAILFRPLTSAEESVYRAVVSIEPA